MNYRILASAALSCAVMFGQFGGGNNGGRVTDTRSAEIRGGGGEGKCTIEVEVDDTADVEISGSQGRIRTVSGSPASFRRFECNQQMPTNATGFRFKGIDGRGQQNLVRGPEGRGPAVIRIVDTKGGREGYTFDIFWTGGGGFQGGNGNGNGGIWNPGNGNGGGWGNGNNSGGWNNGNNAGNNGGSWNTGNGNGWGNGWGGNKTVSFTGRGNGEYVDGNRRGRLTNPTVQINNRGRVDITFQSDQGPLNLNGMVERVEGNRVYARVRGGQVYGTVEIEMQNRNRIRQIYLPMNSGSAHELRWSN